MRRTAWMPADRSMLLCMLSLFVAAGCSPTGVSTTSDGNNPPVVIELADYTNAEVKPSPVGAGRIVGGHLLVDFQDSMSLAEIDALLGANNLQRAGFVSGTNLVTARILDARSELEVQAAIESLPGVEFAVLNHVLEPDDSVGVVPPVLDNRGGTPPFTLSDAELFANWPHYVMDTFPAHALADAVLGGPGLRDVVLAVVDAGGFQAVTTTTGSDSRENSLLSDESGDTDLSTKVVAPTGIVVDQETGIGTIQVGTRDVSFNRLIGTVGHSLHGLEVASAALGAGQDIIGTGRHAKFRPVRISQKTFDGACTNDRTLTCNANNPCPEGTGDCDQGVSTIDYLNAALTLLASDPATNLKVVNLSIGFDIADEAEREKVRAVLSPPFGRLIDGGRLVVVSAGNEAANTADRAFAVLGPTRGAPRSASGSALQKGLVVVGGTSLPEGSPLDVLLKTVDPVLDFANRAEGHDSDAATGDHVRISAPSDFVPVLTGDFTTRRADGGTSFSAPYVAGLAAEMFAIDPSATNVEIIDIIERTADDLGAAGPDEQFGFGRINCWKAILTLLNRKQPADKPDWLGIRFRFALEADDTLQFSIDGVPVPSSTGVRRVPDIPQVMGDNAREVPSRDFLPAAVAAQFSVTTAGLLNSAQGVSLLKVTTGSGAPVYEIPMRLRDLLSARPVDSSLDDYVLTLDIHTRSAAIYGRVTADGAPVEGATLRYLSIGGQESTILSDANGYYTIYDAMPDTQFEIAASQAGAIGDAYDITVKALSAKRQDFLLTKEAVPIESKFPRTYVGTGTRTLFAEWDFLGGGNAVNIQRLDVRITLQENGDVDGTLTTPDGEVVEVPVIGGQPGQTTTLILNNQSVETPCPADAAKNAGKTVKIVQFTFGQIGWGGKWLENGTYNMHFESVYYDMNISGNFSESSISGSGAWPDAQQSPRGQEMSNFICSSSESTFYTRIEWEFTGQLVVDNGN